MSPGAGDERKELTGWVKVMVTCPGSCWAHQPIQSLGKETPTLLDPWVGVLFFFFKKNNPEPWARQCDAGRQPL